MIVYYAETAVIIQMVFKRQTNVESMFSEILDGCQKRKMMSEVQYVLQLHYTQLLPKTVACNLLTT